MENEDEDILKEQKFYPYNLIGRKKDVGKKEQNRTKKSRRKIDVYNVENSFKRVDDENNRESIIPSQKRKEKSEK
jgi:hypothetical protein